MEEKEKTFNDLKAWLLNLQGVSESSHRFGGTEFQLDGVEFMHSHGHSWLDIRLSKQDQTTVLKTGMALPHRFAPEAGWVSFRIENASDLEGARKLARLAYENAKKNLEDVRSRRKQATLT